jgi:hypothetical protein
MTIPTEMGGAVAAILPMAGQRLAEGEALA